MDVLDRLRAAIGEVHGLDPGRIICGVGSDEVLQFVTQAFSGPGDEIIHTEHGFSLYPVLINMAGPRRYVCRNGSVWSIWTRFWAR